MSINPITPGPSSIPISRNTTTSGTRANRASRPENVPTARIMPNTRSVCLASSIAADDSTSRLPEKLLQVNISSPVPGGRTRLAQPGACQACAAARIATALSAVASGAYSTMTSAQAALYHLRRCGRGKRVLERVEGEHREMCLIRGAGMGCFWVGVCGADCQRVAGLSLPVLPGSGYGCAVGRGPQQRPGKSVLQYRLFRYSHPLQHAAQAFQGLDLNLAHSFAADLKVLSQFFQRADFLVVQAKAALDHPAVLVVEQVEPLVHIGFHFSCLQQILRHGQALFGDGVADGKGRVDVEGGIQRCHPLIQVEQAADFAGGLVDETGHL